MRPNTDQDTPNTHTSPHPRQVFDGLERLTVATAAERLGVSQDAVRKRIARDTIPWVKDQEGRVYVYLDPSKTDQDGIQDKGQGTNQDASKTALEIMQEQVDYLKETIRARDEELRRKDHLLAAALERIPELEAPGPREAPETATNLHPSVDPQGDDAGQDTAKSRPWWRKLLGE